MLDRDVSATAPFRPQHLHDCFHTLHSGLSLQAFCAAEISAISCGYSCDGQGLMISNDKFHLGWLEDAGERKEMQAKGRRCMRSFIR
jgi:hypothetical protein